jgi:hypothetical protein
MEIVQVSCVNTVYICIGLKMFICNEWPLLIKMYIYMEELSSLVSEIDLYKNYTGFDTHHES